MRFRFFIILLSVLLSACAGSTNIVVGTVSSPLQTDQVRLFYPDFPDCEFEVIALMQIPGEYHSPQRLIEAFRSRAAALGANAVHVHYLHQEGTGIYRGQARAIRCAGTQSPGP